MDTPRAFKCVPRIKLGANIKFNIIIITIMNGVDIEFESFKGRQEIELQIGYIAFIH